MGETRSMDRRAFCKASAAATAALGALSLVGCQENKLKEEEPGAKPEPGAAFAANEEGAEWFAAPCWHNCGGRCLNKVLMKDGAVLRQKTDDTHEDSYDWPQSRGCLRGRAMQQQVFGADRLKYPMKRKHWEPLTGGQKELRGVDEWERISWDEALDYIIAEIKNAKEKYGNRSILYMNMSNIEGYMGAVLSAFGGYVDTKGTQSPGTFSYSPANFGVPVGELNDRYDIENADYIVLWGHNAAWCAFGNPSYYLKHFKEIGIKFLFVGPEYSVTAGFVDAEWIPVRPGTDTALILGLAHSMIDRDEEGSLIDWDFLNRCTVGFDAEHMPAEAKTNENFRDYVMGVYDGIEKTPEWASEICGTPVETINHFADILSCKNNVYLGSNGAPARCKGAENFPQAFMTIAAMGGHFGKPGNACGDDQYYSAFNRGPKIVTGAYGGTPGQFTNCNNPVDDVLFHGDAWRAILEGKYVYVGDYSKVYDFPAEERDLDIRVIYSENHNFLQSQSNINEGIEAFRKVDFVCSQVYSMKADAMYSDIVLPICTRWEVNRDVFYFAFADKENGFAYRKILDPMYEARSDYDIAEALAERMGLNFSEIIPFKEKQLWFNSLAKTAILHEDGTPGPLCTITQEDIDRYEVEGEPQEGVVEFETFLTDGVYRVPRKKGDAYTHIAFKSFRDDPEGHPIATTASGKMEIYCQAKADLFASMNRGSDKYPDISALPKYLPQFEGYEDSFTDWENKVKGPYPFQMTHVHYLRRAHTDMDNLAWAREAMQNPVFISKEDAAAKGIKDGDTVLVKNDAGSFVRPATVSRCVMPGVIMVPHGATLHLDTESGIDKAGSDNILTTQTKTSAAFTNGWNTTLVDYEKYEGPIELLPDCEWEPVIPLADEK